METKHVVIGVGVLGLVGYFYLRRTGKISSVIPSSLNTMSTKPGYTSMMKVGYSDYNNTSMEGASYATQSFVENGVVRNWSLPAEQGNGMLVSPGWTSYSDAYSARVANAWQEYATQGSHL
jgi:hypothetical protein